MTTHHDDNAPPGDDENLIPADAVARWLGISEVTLRTWRHNGRGPRYIRFSDHPRGKVRYRPADVRRWLEACETPGEVAAD